MLIWLHGWARCLSTRLGDLERETYKLEVGGPLGAKQDYLWAVPCLPDLFCRSEYGGTNHCMLQTAFNSRYLVCCEVTSGRHGSVACSYYRWAPYSYREASENSILSFVKDIQSIPSLVIVLFQPSYQIYKYIG